MEKTSTSTGTKIMQVNNFTYQINTKLKIYDVMKNTMTYVTEGEVLIVVTFLENDICTYVHI